jgi:hypothetical protein
MNDADTQDSRPAIERLAAFRRARTYHRRAHGAGTALAIPGGRPLRTCQSNLCQDQVRRLLASAHSRNTTAIPETT